MDQQSLSPKPADAAGDDPAELARLAALGRMAGKLAHDFRNQLAVIMANAEMLADDAGGAPDARRMLELILSAGERAQDMTQRVLSAASEVPAETAGARRAPAVDSATFVADTERSLKQALGHEVRLNLACGGAGLSRLDLDQLEASIVLLATTARPVMPRGGRLSIAIMPTA